MHEPAQADPGAVARAAKVAAAEPANHLTLAQRCRQAVAVMLTATLLVAVAGCDAPWAEPSVALRTPRPTPSPTPTWTPIPVATATPSPTPSATPEPLREATPPPPEFPTPAPESGPGLTPTGTPTVGPAPTGPPRFSDEELLARLPTADAFADDPTITLQAPGEGALRATDLGLASQFLDPLTVRRGDPFLLAFVLTGQAVDQTEILVIDEMIQQPGELLSNIAGGLVEGLQASARTAKIVEFEVLDPPRVGARSAAARTRVASGADIFEARVAIAERDGVVGLVLQIARLDAVVDLLDAEALLRTIVEAEIPRG